jgi:CheY-like chemotaxis protein
MMILAQMLAANDERNLSGQQREWAETIHSGGRDLLALINEILDLSKVEAGRIDTHFESYSLQELSAFAERTFRPVALQRRLEFSIEVGPGAPPVVTTDRQLLEQVLKNLLANAFKFTEHGRVTLRVERAAVGVPYRRDSLRHAPDVIAFAVTDTGIGISPEQQERIFEAFQQADTSTTRKYGGTGLGLTISREYARVLGGELAVQSTIGAGSTFTLYLPLTPAEFARPVPLTASPIELVSAPEPGPATQEGLASEDTQALAGKQILIVEDDARNLYAITSLLERYQVEVLPASSAREAFAVLAEHPGVDLVLMDVMMPEVDGLQAVRQIRASKQFASLPVIALTAKASESDRAECIAAGFDAYVVKPAETRQLVSVISSNIQR